MHISKFRLFVSALLLAVGFSVVGAGTAYAFQPHMVAARDALTTAQIQLQQADADKGGHREAALNLVQQAIDQVNQGIQFAGG
jgi:hypothetical protein